MNPNPKHHPPPLLPNSKDPNDELCSFIFLLKQDTSFQSINPMVIIKTRYIHFSFCHQEKQKHHGKASSLIREENRHDAMMKSKSTNNNNKIRRERKKPNQWDTIRVCLSLSILYAFWMFAQSSRSLPGQYFLMEEEQQGNNPPKYYPEPKNEAVEAVNIISSTTVSSSLSSTTTTSTNRIVNNQEFSLESDLDLTTPQNCGKHKCFFPSKDTMLKNQIGYLVALGTTKSLFQNMESAWYDVKRIEQQQQQQQQPQRSENGESNRTTGGAMFRHFLAGPPFTVMATNETTLSRLYNYFGNNTASTTNDKATTTFFVQKVYVAPNPSLTLFCHPNQQHKTQQKLSSFPVHVHNKTAFRTQFDLETKTLLNQVLNSTPRLWIDFQVMIDTTGHFYHIDLDRFPDFDQLQKTGGEKFEIWLKRTQQNCIKFLEHVKETIIY